MRKKFWPQISTLFLITAILISPIIGPLSLKAEGEDAVTPPPAEEPAQEIAQEPAQAETPEISSDTPTEPTEPEEPTEPVPHEPSSNEESTTTPETTESASTTEETNSDSDLTTPAVLVDLNTADTQGTTTSTTTDDSMGDPGENGSSGNASTGTTTEISTGDSLTAANLANVANTTSVNSDGQIIFVNQASSSGDIDLRGNLASSTSPSLASCLDGCVNSSSSIELEISHDLDIDNQNDATITNNVDVNATTGGNSITGSTTDAEINTGDAYAAANIINIANTNLVGVEYLLFALNNFGDLYGDIILPGLDFFSFLLNVMGSFSSNVDINNNNLADISNNIEVNALTGENNIAEATSSSITTGDSSTQSQIVNSINKNLVFADPIYIFLRVLGEWTGGILGLPDGLSVQNIDGGLVIYSAREGEFDWDGKWDTDIDNQNTAAIQNNVSVDAVTGQNSIESADNATIKTGDARAVANIMNVANTNIVGKNWIYGLVNIFGNWTGNLSFGRADLFVVQSATLSGDSLGEGEEAMINVTVTNHGDAKANNSDLTIDVPEDLEAGAEDGQIENGHIHWYLGSLAPGETRRHTFSIRLAQTPETSESVVVAEVASNGTDGNTEDNQDTLTIPLQTNNTHHGGGGSRSSGSNDSTFVALSDSSSNNTGNNTDTGQVTVTKTNNVSGSITAPGIVSYKVSVVNTGVAPIKNANLIDILRDPSGKQIATQSWTIGDINPNEEVVIEYDAQFTDASIAGTYTNGATLTAEDSSGNIIHQTASSSFVLEAKAIESLTAPVALASTNNTPPEEEQVVGEVKGIYANLTELALLNKAVSDFKAKETAPAREISPMFVNEPILLALLFLILAAFAAYFIARWMLGVEVEETTLDDRA